MLSATKASPLFLPQPQRRATEATPKTCCRDRKTAAAFWSLEFLQCCSKSWERFGLEDRVASVFDDSTVHSKTTREATNSNDMKLHHKNISTICHNARTNIM